MSSSGTRAGDDVAVGTVATDAALRPERLTSGRFPTGPGQALVASDRAAALGVRVGDEIVVGRAGDTVTARVVGLTRSADDAALLTWPDLARLRGDTLVSAVVVGGGATPADVRAAGLPDRAGVTSAEDFLQHRAQELTRGVDAVSAVLLGFAAVALFVSVLVIANTFSVLLAQRQRELALLRCVGASRQQVRRSVRTEALVIGMGASTLALAVGTGLGHLIVTVVHAVAPGAPVGEAHVAPAWAVGGWVLGVLVTLLASVVPSRRTTRIEPLAALRPLGAVDPRTVAGAGRIGLGLVLAAGGTALLALAAVVHSLPVMLLGGFASFGGLLALGPVVVPACIRAVAAPLGRLGGAPTRLAAANACRHPRRTAATAASLLVGTTLVTGLVVGSASVRGSVVGAMDHDHPVDAVLSSSRPLAPEVAERVRGIDGVVGAAPVRGTTARAAGLGEVTVLGAPGGSLARGAPAYARPAAGTAYVSPALLNEMADQRRIRLVRDGRAVTLRAEPAPGVDGVYVASAELDRLGGASTRAVWVRGSDGRSDADDVVAALGSVARASGADLSESLSDRAYVLLQLDVVLYTVVGLLSIALVIALLGIANTLGLSVLERGREHALLRALGLTRGQLRRMLAAEAVLLAVVTGAIGIAVGAAYASVGVAAVIAPAVPDTGVHVVVPVGQLGLVLLLALVAGLAACLLPARRAARTAPAAGLALE
ncbi:FtsX-like permease family protein [Marmoricola endophyticus]|uniref:FtsX-like permease family protein n=1 Tax=Marmoricola endophyticus TaxID=2040280 RepID=UPI001669664A|nr:FtsX-like permease family protein [Marmoricola endophyticus]